MCVPVLRHCYAITSSVTLFILILSDIFIKLTISVSQFLNVVRNALVVAFVTFQDILAQCIIRLENCD